MNQEKKPLSSLNKTRILAVVLLIFSPLSYLEVAHILDSGNTTYKDPGIMMPLFLIIAVLSPFVWRLIEREAIRQENKGKRGFKSPDDAWLKLFIIRATLNQAIFVYGLMIFFFSLYDTQKMLYFYPIGVVWAFFTWPTRKRYENFISQFEKQ